MSSEHASIHWDGGGWQLRDLASRNGTFLRRERVQAEVGIASGDEVRFGGLDGPTWVLVRANAPAAQARAVGSTRWIDGEDSHLVLPDDVQPFAVVSEHEGDWFCEVIASGERTSVRSGELLELDGVQYELLLPAPSSQTADAEPRRLMLARVVFAVSQDQEHVVMEVRGTGGGVRVDHHAFHDVLLALAHARLEERALRVADAEEGWLHIDELAKALGSSRERINLDVFRARQHLARLGFEDAASIVERRVASRTLRLGVRDVVVSSPAGPRRPT